MFYEYNPKTKKSKPTNIKRIVDAFKINRKTTSLTLSNIITADTETNIDSMMKNKKKIYRGYIVMGQINIDGRTYWCREADELTDLFKAISNKIAKECNPTSSGKLPKVRIYFHNLAYDFYFMKLFLKERGDIDIFGGELSVIYANFDNIQFCCSYKLFDASLDRLCKTYKISNENSKIKGGWDYNKKRTPSTTLTPLEIQYGMNDIIALYDLIKIKADEWGDVSKIPYTKTGEVRESIKKYSTIAKAYSEDEINKFKEKYTVIDISDKATLKNRKVTDITLKKSTIRNGKQVIYMYKHHRVMIRNEKGKNYSLETVWEYDVRQKKYAYSKMKLSDFRKSYELQILAFAGGFVKGVQDILGLTLENVHSFDLTSAYPAMCLTKKFGLGFKPLVKPIESYYDHHKKEFNTKKDQLLFVATFKNIRAKHGISLFSLSKSEDLSRKYPEYNIDINRKDSEDVDNGRIKHAKEISIAIIADEFNHLHRFYTWDSVKFTKVFVARKSYLPETIIQSTNEFYSNKCKYKKQLNDLSEDDPEYATVAVLLHIAKTKLNSIYGCMATNLLKYEIPEDATDEEIKDIENEFFENYYNCSKLEGRSTSKYASPLAFDFAMQITAFVRCTIYELIERCQFKNIAYSDTDSLKIIIKNEEHLKFVKKQVQIMNENIINEVKACQAETHFDTTDWTQDGKMQWIGIFDCDGEYLYFKTLGAKRYAYICYNKKDKKYEFKTTVAGIGKKVLAKEIFKVAGVDKEKFEKEGSRQDCLKLMRYFNLDMKVSEDVSEKKTHKYSTDLEEVKEWNDPDTWNDGIRSGSYIVLEPATFAPKNKGSLIYDVVERNLRKNSASKMTDKLLEAV